jgi:hypothetical protein
MSVRLSAYISAAPNGRIYVKFATGKFMKICREIPDLDKTGQKILVTLYEDVPLLPATLNRQKSFRFERN